MFKTGIKRRLPLFLLVCIAAITSCSGYLLTTFPGLMLKAHALPASAMFSTKAPAHSGSTEGKELSNIMHDLGMSSSLLNMGFPDPFDFPFGRYRQNMPTVRKFREDLATSGAMPAINLDVSETKTDWHIKADIPGMKKEDIKVTFDDGTLEISAERKYSRQSEDANKDSKADTAKEEDYHKFHFSEITYGKVYRSLKFPPTADAQKLDAKYENGVLHITLGKKNVDEKTKKVIEIK